MGWKWYYNVPMQNGANHAMVEFERSVCEVSVCEVHVAIHVQVLSLWK